MPSPPAGYIDLDRRFISLNDDSIREDAAIDSYTSVSKLLEDRNSLGWSDVLKHRLVVILGEAGSGKTFEFRNQAIAGDGVFKFFVRLDELTSAFNGLPLTTEAAQHFSRWKDSGERAVFFLDSVDEAKIHQSSDFHRALDRFSDALGFDGRARATIIISSRVTEWLPTVDAHELRTRIPIRSDNPQSEGNAKEKSTPLVLQLLPLDKQRVSKYVRAKSIADADRFLDAIERAHAWEFARRPADVDDLLDFWREKGHLGTLTEILTFTTDRQLQKTSDREREELLTLDRARTGAEYLAAATVLCRRFAYRIPGEPNPSESSIDALACLPTDWRPEEVRALFSHAIFDGSSYGQIRFHHRRLSEFLAARWLSRLINSGCPVAELESLLFQIRGPQRTIRPVIAPVAAWLCSGKETWNRRVLRWILDASPEILLRFGDPAQLPLEDRRELLLALSRRAEGRQRLWWQHDVKALSRLADPALAKNIVVILESPSTGHNLREFALTLVAVGKIKECSGTVLKLAISDLTKGEYFPYVARALEKIAEDDELKTLADASLEVSEFPESVCVPLCELLFPRIWNADQLVHNLSRAHPSDRGQFAWDYTLSAHLEAIANNSNGLALLRNLLNQHSQSEEEWSDELHDFQKPWQVRLAISVAIGMLRRSRLTDDEAAAVSHALVQAGRYLSETRSRDTDEDINTLSQAHPVVRGRYFESANARMAQVHRLRSSSLSTIAEFYDALNPNRDDLVWILDAIRNATASRDRQQLLGWALELWDGHGRSKVDLIRIRATAHPFPDLRRAVRQHLHPGVVAGIRRFWYRKIKYRSYRFHLRQVERGLRNWWEKVSSDWRLFWHRRKVASGQYDNWLADLILETHGNSGSRWVPKDWSLLRKRRGNRCALAARSGCKAVWRNYEPPLPPHKKSSGTERKTIVGLAGIMAAWQDGELDFAKLPPDDARRATHYALSELNGFTDWFPELAQKQPAVVQAVLIECIKEEWSKERSSDHSNLVLSNLAWTGGFACPLVSDFIFDLLASGEPRSETVLRYALCVLVAVPDAPRSRFAVLADLRSEAIPVCAPTFPMWMSLWLQTDALSALVSLERRLITATDPVRAMVNICSSLGGDSLGRLPLLVNPSWLSAEALRGFIPLVYKYVRREDDLKRPSGVGYTPTDRDDAQHFRNGLLERLAAIRDPMVEKVLRDLLAEPVLSNLSDYIRHLLEKSVELLADGPPWGAHDVRTFGAEYERDPKSDSDLYHLVIRRLQDLKEWVEIGENSPREEVHQTDNEEAFRRWIERRLMERSKNRYLVPQEWELDQRVRPDLRVVTAGMSPVSIEVKVADNWTVSQLIEGLYDQLVGRYLRDSKARYGVYLLALFDRNRTWRADDQKILNADDVVAILEGRAADILKERLDIAGLKVLLIHFSSPLPNSTKVE
jgi:hypothetical protein